MAEILQFPCPAGSAPTKRRTRGPGKPLALRRFVESGDAYKPEGVIGAKVTTVPLGGSVLMVGDTLDDFEQQFIADFIGRHLTAAMASIRKTRGSGLAG